MGNGKAEQSERGLESTGGCRGRDLTQGGGWSRQTSQTKQRLSSRKLEISTMLLGAGGGGMRTPGVGSLLPAEGMPRSQGGKGSQCGWREEWAELLEMGVGRQSTWDL